MVQLAHSERRRVGTDRVQRVLQLALQLDNMGTWDPVRLTQEKERRWLGRSKRRSQTPTFSTDEVVSACPSGKLVNAGLLI